MCTRAIIVMLPVVVVVIAFRYIGFAFRYNDPAFRFVGFPPTTPFNGYPIATFVSCYGDSMIPLR